MGWGKTFITVMLIYRHLVSVAYSEKLSDIIVMEKQALDRKSRVMCFIFTDAKIVSFGTVSDMLFRKSVVSLR